jgi:hypothetical protein
MISVEENEVSHISEADDIAQKRIASWKPQKLTTQLMEIRMHGKALLYVLVPDVNSLEEGEVPRLIILGAHGDNAQTQTKFIKHVS